MRGATDAVTRWLAGEGSLRGGLEPRLLAVALRLTRDPDAARDVVQNAYEKALRHASGFRGESRVSTWLHRIVTNEALMWLRHEKRRARRCQPLDDVAGAALPDPAPTPLQRAADRQRLARVREGLATLAPRDRALLEQGLLRGLDYAEIGRRTGRHPATLKTRAFRARRRLAGLLGDA